MTEQDFNVFTKKLQRKRFPKRATRDLGPLTNAVLRAKFNVEKLRELIFAAESVTEDRQAIAQKLARWRERLARMEQAVSPLGSLKKEITQAQLEVSVRPLKEYISSRRIRTE